ncbi:MAG: polysaccharide deacetylase family protein [Bacteriovoracaceae bacterium]|nr:polysaccharide deacetylase family protein [Bacteriovoracaceae bacterium]
MKTLTLAALLLLSTKSFADFSEKIIGDESKIQDKDFSKNNMERLHRGHNEIVLTFDDGPTPGVTDKILDTLKENNVKATFFVIAEKAKDQPELMKRILNEGHIVANHSLSHHALKDLSFFSWKKTVKKEVLDAHEILAPYMTNSKNFFYRAPEGAWDGKYAGVLNQSEIGKQYIGPVLWDIGGAVEFKDGQYLQAADWACWSKKITVDECLSGYLYEAKKVKGGVVLMHDLRTQSAEMLAKFIPALEASGFTFKNLDDVNWNK